MNNKIKIILLGLVFFVILSSSVVYAEDNSSDIVNINEELSQGIIDLQDEYNVNMISEQDSDVLSYSDDDLFEVTNYPYTTKSVTIVTYNTVSNLQRYDNGDNVNGYIELKEIKHKNRYNSITNTYCVSGANVTYVVKDANSKLIYHSSVITDDHGSFKFISNKELSNLLSSGYYKAFITATHPNYKNINSLSWTIDASDKPTVVTIDGVTYANYPESNVLELQAKYKGKIIKLELTNAEINKIKNGKVISVYSNTVMKVPLVKFITKYSTKNVKTKVWAWKYYKKTKNMKSNPYYLSKTFKNAMKNGKYVKTITKNTKYGKICYQIWKIPKKIKKEYTKKVRENKQIFANFFRSTGGQYEKGYYMGIGYDGADRNWWIDYKIHI